MPSEDHLLCGQGACAGCGVAIAVKNIMRILGENTTVYVPASCLLVFGGGMYPHSAFDVPFFYSAFENTGAVISGIKAGYRRQGKDVTVIGIAGDGGTFDIGLQALSAAAERNDDFIYAVYDNEAYMNTGIQRSSATPYGAWTTTTPAENFKQRPKKDMVRIMAAHRIPYIATASVAYPEDFIRKFTRAKALKGMRFIHILAPCPVGWRAQPQHTIKIARLAVRTRLFPLLEIEDGVRWRLTVNPANPRPVSEYLALQGRFKHLTTAQVESIQESVDRNWGDVAALAGAAAVGAAPPDANAAADEP